MAAIIFDFDGTLADTFPLVVDISYELSGAQRLPAEKIESLRALPLLEAVRALGVPRLSLIRLSLQTRSRMYPRMHEVRPFPGVAEMLKTLHDAGHKLYVLSSNHERNVRAFLEAHQLAGYFDDVAGVFYGNVFYKVRGLRALVSRRKLSADACVYVGNEPLDMLAAARLGMQAVAVTWSGQQRAALLDAHPGMIIDTPTQLVKAIKEVAWKK
jgi:phosphoglycolate phosphatase